MTKRRIPNQVVRPLDVGPKHARRPAAHVRSDSLLGHPQPIKGRVQAAALTDVVLEIGVLDVNAWLAGLPRLLGKLNKAQSQLRFAQVQAPLPAGLLKSRDALVSWVMARYDINEKGAKEIQRNVLADEFFTAAEDIRRSLELDYFVGVTSAMVAGTEADRFYWNYFGVSGGKLALISTADIRRYAAEAGRSFDAAVGALLLAQTLVTIDVGAEFHDENRGCLFDFNESRETLIETFRTLRIEPACIDKLQAKYRNAAIAMLAVLRRL